MTQDFNNFISSIFGERVATPLYRTFAVSWMIWNWRAFYITFFVSESSLPLGKDKLDRILEGYCWWLDGLLVPLLITGLYIFILPYAANYTYKKSLLFKRARINDKLEILEKDRALLPERVLEIRKSAQDRVELVEKDLAAVEKAKGALERTLREMQTEHETKEAARLSELKKFKVLFAKFGREGADWGWNIETEALNRGIKDNELKFTVSNNAFDHEDPAKLMWKEVMVVYQWNGEINGFIAMEGDQVIIKDGIAQIIQGNQSKATNNLIRSGIFPGR